MMVLAGSLALAERAVEPLRGCVRRSLFNTIFKKAFLSAVPVGFAIRDPQSRKDEVDGCGWLGV